MNIELTGIAEKKINQMAGTPCGVLVRHEDGTLMAVSEHGRCTRLDESVMGPVDPARQAPASGEVEPVAEVVSGYSGDRDTINSKAIKPLNLQHCRIGTLLYTHPKPAQQGSGLILEIKKLIEEEGFRIKHECRFCHTTACDHAEEGDLLLEADDLLRLLKEHTDASIQPAQQWSVPKPFAVIRNADKFIREGLGAAYRASMVPRRTGDIVLYTHPQPAQQGSVPERWRDVIQGAIDELSIMDESEGIAGWHLNGAVSTWDESGLPAIRDALTELLATTPQPEGDGWVKCSERLPKHADRDVNNEVWVTDGKSVWVQRYASVERNDTHHWMPTGLKRPTPPQEQ